MQHVSSLKTGWQSSLLSLRRKLVSESLELLHVKRFFFQKCSFLNFFTSSLYVFQWLTVLRSYLLILISSQNKKFSFSQFEAVFILPFYCRCMLNLRPTPCVAVLRISTFSLDSIRFSERIFKYHVLASYNRTGRTSNSAHPFTK